MDCQEARLLLSEYILSFIRDPAVAWQAVGQHVETCVACQQKYRQVQRL